MMDSTNIESIGVNSVRSFFERSKVVSTFIADNDKEPCWDGFLYLYRNDGKPKSNLNLIGRIATQVKGKSMRNFKTRNFSFPVDIPALKQYRLDGGTIFFVVQITDSGKMIFYKELTPVIISSVLKLHGKQKSVSLKFKPFPSDLAEAEQLLIELHANLKKQAPAINHDPLDFDALRNLKPKGLTFVTAAPDKSKSPAELVTEKPIQLYATFDNGIPDLPIGDGPASVVASRMISAPVSVDGTTYFNSYKNSLSSDFLTINIADCFVMNFPRNEGGNKVEAKVNFSSKNQTLRECCNTLGFICSAIDCGSMTVGDHALNFKIGGKNKIIKELRQLRTQYQSLLSALDSLGVCEEILPDEMGETDNDMAYFISDLCDPAIIAPLPDELKGLRKIKIANLTLLLYFYEQDAAARVKSIFDEALGLQAKYRYPEGTIEESVFGAFSKEDFSQISNMPYKEIIPSYERLLGSNPYVANNLNMVGLTLMSAYDMMSDTNRRKSMIASTVIDIFEYLPGIDKANSTLYFINRCQMLKRLNTLTDEDSEKLNAMIFDDSFTAGYKCGAALITDNRPAFNRYWKELDRKQQTQLTEFPIWKLRGSWGTDSGLQV